MAFIAGATAVLIKRFSHSLRLAIPPLVLIAFTLFTAYLARVEIVFEEEGKRKQAQKLTVLLTTYERRILEVGLCFAVISSAYYPAFALRYEFRTNDYLLWLFLSSLPIVIAATYAALLFFGIYRRLWRYTELGDLVRMAQAVICGPLLSMAALSFVYRFVGYSRRVFIVYGLLLFFGIAGSRLSFRLFDLFLGERPRDSRRLPGARTVA